jgi:hypothetical protein
MRIGLDFDNTIVCYDTLFHRVALGQDVIPAGTPANKLAVRDHLRAAGRESIWTEMQGVVYGARMDEAQTYPGVIEFMRWAREVGHTVAIISHKTRHPFLGPQYDLHAAARSWISHHLCEGGQALMPADRIFFELTKEEKLARIADFHCDLFLDDLPEILMADAFPSLTRRALFDPDGHHSQASVPGGLLVRSWQELSGLLMHEPLNRY